MEYQQNDLSAYDTGIVSLNNMLAENLLLLRIDYPQLPALLSNFSIEQGTLMLRDSGKRT